ncbi:MAG: YihY family inner membrane protein [Betaproteobacteria bacterium]
MEKKPRWRRFADFVAAVSARFTEERGLQVAASLTYTTLLSLVPLFTVALAVSTAFPAFDETVDALQLFVFENFLPDARGVDTIAEQIASFTQNAGRLTAIGIAFFAVTAVLLIRTIDEALNGIFRVQRPRPVLQRVLIYWAVLTLGPALVGGSLSATSFAVAESFGWLQLDILADAILRVLPFAFTCVALTLLYAVVPYRRVPWRHALAGAILAGIAFELAKRGFAQYLVRFPTYTLIYGAFATIPIFLVWMYLSWVVVLAGAALTAMLPAYYIDERKPLAGSDFVDALAVLSALAQAHADGRILTLRRLTAQLRLMPHRCEQVLERSRVLGWTARTEKDGWVLTRDPAGISVTDLFRAFVFDAQAAGLPEGHLGLSLKEYAEK